MSRVKKRKKIKARVRLVSKKRKSKGTRRRTRVVKNRRSRKPEKKRETPSTKPKAPWVDRTAPHPKYIPVVGDEDELEEWAEQWGVSVNEAEDMLEYLEESTNIFDPPLNDYGIPDDDYMNELADTLGIDVSDLYDMYYGYSPGES